MVLVDINLIKFSVSASLFCLVSVLLLWFLDLCYKKEKITVELLTKDHRYDRFT